MATLNTFKITNYNQPTEPITKGDLHSHSCHHRLHHHGPQCHHYHSQNCRDSNVLLDQDGLLLLKIGRIFICGFPWKLAFLLILSSTCLKLSNGASLHHKEYRSAGLFALNNFTDLYDSAASSTSVSSSIKTMDLTSVEQNDVNVPDYDAPPSPSHTATRNLQLDTKQNTGCPLTTSSHCLKCNREGCIKCTFYLVTDTRQCVERCPSGYVDQWSAHTEFMGRVCVPIGYSGALMAALAGMFGGFLVCLSILAVAVMLVKRRRRRKAIKQKLINENTMDRSDFLRQLNDMRPNAEYFLAMLNDTRRQIRKLYLAGDVAAANSYRPIVRDLARILILLNRPIELIPAAPHDWNRLYTWSEQVLERYRPQVGQLIDFFQNSNGVDVDEFDATSVYRQKVGGGGFYKQSATLQSSSNLTAGKGGGNGSKTQKMHLFGSLISLHEFEEPRPSDPFGSSFNTLKSGNLISDLNASSLWLEDEFYKLGFRPQDEITTEL
ncbi:uncharacterized protein LOC105261998 [Musca domestica]|uniref:Uncharacterized protein LOC105261998 n=1 Tax=Musca domestica TaxID=7370 RepID=A0ABM3UMF4_MUSDO|nr:uncharacterized protein LOC105261998 [Musca domestica]